LNYLLSQGLRNDLVLADGRRWVIAAGDEEAASIVSQLGDAMQLHVMSPSASLPPATFGTSRTGAAEPPHHGIMRHLFVLCDAHNPEASAATFYAPLPFEDNGFIVCVLNSFPESDRLYIQLVQLSLIFAHDAQTRGGVLLHGALAEKDGIGVILAAPGGTGKTTASNRLPAPWHSLCDDTTLVVRDSQGNYWAHPWPTWSRFVLGRSGGTWDVQNAVPLKAVFFLSQAVEDRVESVGPGHAVSLLVECAGQNSQLMARGLSKEETRALRLERFNNLCALARVVPAHVLRISLTGTFWQKIEQVLQRSHLKEPE
jgi:SynChlorMet cassette protein ScmC